MSARTCRIILAALLLFGFFSHLHYLRHNCPIDLSFDEAHYWDWSRALDWSYYSKGPLVAFIIRASCATFGDVMWAVRFPALLFAIGTSLVTYLLTKKLFDSERIALGAVMLNHVVPMFIAGSVLMTIDPPFFFCWALATYFACIALFDEKRWAWVVIGIVVGVGFLAKYAMFLWFLGLLVFMLIDPLSRKRLKSVWPWVSVLVALVFTIPVVVWNSKHGWVSFRHVATQTGASEPSFTLAHFAEFLGGQVLAIGPILIVIIGTAVAYAIRGYDARRRQMRFLVSIGLTFFVLVMFTSFAAKVQVNWPAPAYFTLLILATYFLATRMREGTWRKWKPWVIATAIIGLIIMPIAHDTELIYPLAKKFGAKDASFDPSYRMRGWHELGEFCGKQLLDLGRGGFILCEKYDQTSETAFYTPGQPKTFYAGSYFKKPSERQRQSQYDMWPDRALDQPKLLGKNAIYVGYMTSDIRYAFDTVEPLPDVEIVRNGLFVRRFLVWRCTNFKGMKRPADAGRF